MLRLKRKSDEAVYQFRNGVCVARYVLKMPRGQRAEWCAQADAAWRYVREEALTATEWAAVEEWEENHKQQGEP